MLCHLVNLFWEQHELTNQGPIDHSVLVFDINCLYGRPSQDSQGRLHTCIV